MSQDGAQGTYEGRSVGRGRYQLRDLLGAGGMAAVHLAYDTVLDREVAIKTLHTELGREAAFRERFRREAQSVAKLTHTNIVSVYDSGEDELDGGMVPYIVMEYVAGDPLRTTLDTDIAQHGAMPAEKALKITADVLAALDVSHEMGLVHRDIKPGNVMITKRGVVKVMDFGIARAMQSGVTSMTQTGMVVGTPQYLSPEQALGRGVDARSDLYSVGIMLFELVTGQLPFDADSPLAIAYAHVQEEPPVPSSINRSLPAGVDALIARTLKKNPSERFPTAEAMREECLRLAGSGQTGGTPLIISEGPRARTSGASVASTVFPTASPTTPPPPTVQPTYQPQQPGPYGPPVGMAGPHTPPPPTAYATPAPGPVPGPAPMTPQPFNAGMQPPTAGMQTPPPYSGTPAPVGGGGARKSNTAVVVVSVIVGVVILTALAIGIGLSVGDDSGSGDDNGGSSPEPTYSSDYSYSSKPSVTGDSISTSECTGAAESAANPGKYLMPFFHGKTIESVKACLNAVHWKYTTKEAPNSLYAKGVVIDQSPSAVAWWNPKTDDPIQLTVANGNSE
ncbi:protein kinase [Streptomyces sp. NPDC059740]|uniref:protein kinase domain-containing protein n=1 Tax=Streptomyces sp. NPDC059740 TaxID=3346926 RepID=UPI00364966EE